VSSLKKQIRRQKEKEAKKELQEKVGLFNKLGEECLVCQKDFDKKNREMVMSWSVVVKEDAVRLYCPDCWDRATNLVKEIKDGQTDTKNNV
jgi:hypothetical protein|tara:strand:+ start:640 stop:912 length:273 start_codon:yes stop_codon:yes gene_type:complete